MSDNISQCILRRTAEAVLLITLVIYFPISLHNLKAKDLISSYNASYSTFFNLTLT